MAIRQGARLASAPHPPQTVPEALQVPLVPTYGVVAHGTPAQLMTSSSEHGADEPTQFATTPESQEEC